VWLTPPDGAPRRRRRGLVVLLAVIPALALLVIGAGLLVWFVLLDSPYDVDDWRAANPARSDRGTATPVLERHVCPFAGEEGAEGVRCATLVVPADRHDATDDAVVELAVAILPATGPAPAADPILYLEGGPGGASVAWFDAWLDPPWSRLRRDRDVILLDQRGTGYSTPSLGCEEEWGPSGDAYVEAVLGCRDDAVGGGAGLPGVSTREHAADAADLREALGVEEWNLLGISYGTRVALAILRDHPEGVRSAILDSVYPPGVEVLVEQGEVAVAAFDALAEACVLDVGCRDDHGDPRTQLALAAAALDASPIDMDGTRLEGSDLVAEVVLAMYDTTLLAELPAIIATAVDDPEAAFEELGWWYDDAGPPAYRPPSRRPVPAYEDSAGTFYAVECREEVAGADVEAARARTAALPAPFAAAASLQLEELVAICADYGSGSAGAGERAPAVSDVPALLLAGGLDPVTPPAWARLASDTLSSSSVVEFPAVGHGVFPSGSCPSGLVTAFLDDPTGAPEASCAAAYDRPRFVP
jgi:pimeloyl-ACP methyl ester carboxylesterase